jgi:sec-independent protein translocase protein TatB
MFDFSWAELMVIGAVALIAIGPKELPAVLRALGQWTTKIRRMASEFQSQFQEAMREAEMADLKKEVDAAIDLTSSPTSQFDPPDIKEATKWEPKSDSTAGSTAGSTTDSTADETKAREAPPASEAVTADGYSAPAAATDTPAMTEPAPPPAAIEHASAASELPTPGAAPAAIEHASAPPVAPVPEGSGRA